jgi:hypothetical protein
MAARLGGDLGGARRLESSRYGYSARYFDLVRESWRRYQQLGPSGLREQSRAPHRHPLKTSAEIQQEVATLRQKFPPSVPPGSSVSSISH